MTAKFGSSEGRTRSREERRWRIGCPYPDKNLFSLDLDEDEVEHLDRIH
jgi:hypothetical protein